MDLRTAPAAESNADSVKHAHADAYDAPSDAYAVAYRISNASPESHAVTVHSGP